MQHFVLVARSPKGQVAILPLPHIFRDSYQVVLAKINTWNGEAPINTVSDSEWEAIDEELSSIQLTTIEEYRLGKLSEQLDT